MWPITAGTTYQVLLSLLLCATFSHSSPSNRTVDDQKGDNVTGAVPTYSPIERWNIGQTCVACVIHPGIIDPSQAFDGTWHDTTHWGSVGPDTDMSVQVDFTGTAVYMYNILVNTAGSAHTFTQLYFYLDGDQVGTFTHEPDETSQVIYNALVYANTTLSNAPHSLRAVLSGNVTILSLFDYVIYTVEEDAQSPALSSASPPSSSSSAAEPQQTAQSGQDVHATAHVAAIVGGIVGGVVALIAAISILLLLRHRRAQQRRQYLSSTGPLSPQAQAGTDMSDTPCTVAEAGPLLRTPSDKLRQMQNDKLHQAAFTTPFPHPQSPLDASFPVYDRTSPVSSSPKRSAYLTQQMQILQAQVDELRAARGAAGATSSDASSSDSEVDRSLSVLRAEIATLRAELGEQQNNLLLDLPPSYKE